MKKALTLALALMMVLCLTFSVQAEEEPVKLYFVTRTLGNSGSEDTMIVDFLEEKFNVDITWECIPSTNYQQITRNMVAAGASEWPDLMEYQDSSLSTLRGFVEDGFLTPLSALLEEYGQNMLRVRSNPLSWEPIDGEIYVIPCRYPMPESFQTIRQDWLDNLGLEMPTTLDELIEVARAFTFDDPDQDGQDDTYGFGGPLDGNYYDIMYPILASFGVKASTQAVHESIQGEEFVYLPWRLTQNCKEAIKYFRDNVYLPGLCDPDFMVMSRQDYLDKKNANTYGIEYWYLTHVEGGWMTTFMEMNPDAVVASLPIMDHEGYDKVWPRPLAAPGVSSNGFNAYIPSSCEHPELVIQILDYLATDEGFEMVKWGFEGYSFIRDENGKNVAVNDLTEEECEQYGVKHLTDAELQAMGSGMYTGIFWVDQYRWTENELLVQGLADVTPYLYNGRSEPWKYDGDTAALGGVLNSNIVMMMTDPDVDIDAAFEEMLNEYYTMGGRDYLRWYNEQLLNTYGDESMK